MNRWFAVVPLVVLVALAALFIGWSLKRDPAFKPDALIGQPIPATVLPVLTDAVAGPATGSLASVAASAGGPVVVNIFASWCAPCRVEHPRLMALQAQGVTVIGVAYKDEPEATRAFLDELGDPFTTVLVDREGRAGLDLGVSGVPESFVIDANGIVVAKHSGPLIEDADVARLTAALAGSSGR
ncbi:DsbE family thiol:disulfide interchange protein [Brevundimonas variabilis]|uniref:Cytochrome c biogenesis protein CcmG/thiol:disulfide interchange protein DsbE n=1 Tax=Brevundimonas variabilis TaxID=74312 RepID=A0A7W9CGV6_9CAUL|nr:DsbE family thiol:disulfide interchange protein [Brevundimonas variabilis]MBB5744947.1 cytochrome c biogenesis protein CcmG/thiol:disulfide interchange protein DsbE [Brevundimonas variabilis]